MLENYKFCFKIYFCGQNRLKSHIELWVALIEIAHCLTYIGLWLPLLLGHGLDWIHPHCVLIG